MDDYDKFRQSLNDWFDRVSTDMCREIMSELDDTMSRMDDPRIEEELHEIRQIVKSAGTSWEHGDFETAGAELARLRERL